MSLRFALALCLLGSLWLPQAKLWAQLTEGAAATQPSKPASPVVGGPGLQKEPLDIFVLRNKGGELVKMPGWTLEEFMKVWDQQRGLAPVVPPSYSFDSLQIVGRAEEGVAKLQVQLSIRVREEGWVKIPLRLSQAIAEAAPVYEGPGEHLFTAGAGDDGYIFWLKGKEARPHQLKLTMRVPLHKVGEETRLDLTLPRATESRLQISVPLEAVEVQLKEVTEALVTTQKTPGGTSEIQALGLAGVCQLLWRPSLEKNATGPLLEASSEIAVRIEGQSRISSDARFRVRSYSGPLETFRVNLPAGMTLQPASPTGYSARIVTPKGVETEGSKPDTRQTVEIKLDRPTSGVAEVQLIAVLAPDAQAGQIPLHPASFDIIGGVRQRGTIDFSVDGNWQLDWQTDANSRRLSLPPPTNAGAETLVARFEYFRQPCALEVRVAPQPTRISVEPFYLVYADAKQLRLEATLKYRLRGARAADLSFDLRGWQFDKISPESVIDGSLAVTNESDELVLPLRLAAASGELELKLQAHRDLVPGSPTIDFSLPRPIADVVTPANLVVVPADNIDLTPDLAASKGLSADSLPAGLKLPPRQQSPLVYRDSGTREAPRLVSGFQIRSRRTTVTAAARVQFDRQIIRVQQRLNYRIAHEPQKVFSLLTPLGFDPEQAELRIMLGNEVLPLVTTGIEPTETADFRGRVRFTAPSEQLGPCEFVVQYTLPVPPLRDNKTVAISIPLLAPPTEDIQATLGQSLQMTWSGGLLVAAPAADATEKSPWNLETVTRQEIRVNSSRLVPSSTWNLALDPNQRGNTTAVQRALMQTWLTSTRQVQRAALRVRTSAKELQIRVPNLAEAADVQLALDGRPLVDATREADLLRLTLPPGFAERDFVLELWLTFPRQKSGWLWQRDEIAPPILLDSTGTFPIYWQLFVDSAEQLVAQPHDFVCESRPPLANWLGIAVADNSSERLNEWIGAKSLAQTTSASPVYVYSSFGSLAPLPVISASSRLLLWTASFALLMAGLLFIHVAAVRQPTVLLFFGIGLATVTFAFPDLSRSASQAVGASLMVLLATLLWNWRKSFSLGTSPEEYTAAAMSTLGDSQKKQPALARPERPASISTATAPLLASSEQRP